MADFKYKLNWIPDSKKLRETVTPDAEPQGIASRPAPAQDKKEDMGYVTKEELSSAIGEIKATIDEIKEMMKPKEEDLSNDSNTLKSRTVKEEFSDVKEELSVAAAKPIKHNPEAEGTQKKRVEFVS